MQCAADFPRTADTTDSDRLSAVLNTGFELPPGGLLIVVCRGELVDY